MSEPSEEKVPPTGEYYLNDEFLVPEEAESESDVLIIDECIRSENKLPPSKAANSSFGPVEADEKKFEQVENELEALFAGVESDEGKVEKKPGDKEPEQAKVKGTLPAPKTTRPYRKRADKTSSKVATGPTPKPSQKLKRKKNVSEQEGLLEKYRGPFLRIQGPDPLNSVWSNIINFSHDPISPESESRLWSSLGGIAEREHGSRMAGLTLAALLSSGPSSAYDDNWVCVFCKNRSHHQGLGDLFGPYFVPSELMKDFVVPKKSKPSDLAAKFILGGGAESSVNKKRKRKKAVVSLDNSGESSNETEVWMHEDCICWIQDIQILGHRLVGLERALEDANKTRCAICSLNGCSFGCSHVGCRRVAHYPCASTSKWTLDENEFQAFCLDHSKSN